MSEGTRFSPGDVLAGRFRIVRYLARGGMGEVYEAEDETLHERIALKAVHPEVAGDPRSVERFRWEVQLAQRLRHPNVCCTYEFFQHGDVSFLTMELLRGESLEDRLERSGPMTVAEALPIVRQMGSALSAAHELGVVHGDFKSGNVMLVPSEDEGVRAVVTDFGTDPFRTAGTPGAAPSEVVVGTPAYMAPEQARGEALTPAVDIYAFGVVLYEMVTGALPHHGETVEELLGQTVDELAPSPRDSTPGLDVRWELVILRCLQPEPEDRFTSVKEVLEALEGRAIARSVRARFEARRRLLLLALAAILAAAAAFVTWRLMR